MFLYFCVWRRDCGFFGVQSARKKHTKEECPRLPVNCYYASCDWQGDINELKQHGIDAHEYTYFCSENGKFDILTFTPEWTQSYWHHSVGDVALVLFKYKCDDTIAFACCAIDNNPRGTLTLRNNANDKRSLEFTIPIESVRKYTTAESRRQLSHKVAMSFFANNQLEVCFNM